MNLILNKQAQHITSWHKKKPKPCKTGASAPVSAVFSGDKLSLASASFSSSRSLGTMFADTILPFKL